MNWPESVLEPMGNCGAHNGLNVRKEILAMSTKNSFKTTRLSFDK